ncbi:MAG: hypothetical protein R3208_09195 [Ketobacteraceae bacterium]|nr:hypothetical protein [Ketobacteraceae bacterium]
MIRHGSFVLVNVVLFLLATSSYANSPALTRWAFTDEIINSTPTNELQLSSLSKGDIYIYTRWENLAVTFYDVEVFIYDGNNAVVGYSNYGFKPDKPVWDSWTRYHFRAGTDEPGQWRFVVLLNKTKMLEEYIYIEP